MRRFVLIDQQPRSFTRVFQPLERPIGSEIRDVPLGLLSNAVFDELRILVQSLPGQDIGVVEPARLVGEVPFTYDGRAVPGFA